jgi:hypothetical protein
VAHVTHMERTSTALSCYFFGLIDCDSAFFNDSPFSPNAFRTVRCPRRCPPGGAYFFSARTGLRIATH